MSADAVLVVADTLCKHGLESVTGKDWGCACGERFPHRPDFYVHQSAAVVDALVGLEREWGSQMLGDDEITIGSEGTARFCAQQHPLTWTALSRWVSGWVREPAEEDQP